MGADFGGCMREAQIRAKQKMLQISLRSTLFLAPNFRDFTRGGLQNWISKIRSAFLIRKRSRRLFLPATVPAEVHL